MLLCVKNCFNVANFELYNDIWLFQMDILFCVNIYWFDETMFIAVAKPILELLLSMLLLSWRRIKALRSLGRAW